MFLVNLRERAAKLCYGCYCWYLRNPAARRKRAMVTSSRRPILHVLTTNQRRGAEVAGFELASELDRRGLISKVVCLRGVGSDVLPVEPLGGRPLGLRTLHGLRQAARDASLVVAHGSAALPACAIALTATNVPFVYVNIGDLQYWAPPGLRRLRVRLALRRAAAVTALTERSAATIVKDFRVDERKVTVVPNFRWAARFHPPDPEERANARDHFGLSSEDGVVLYVGSLSPEKRVDLAIKAVAATERMHLVIAGAGPLERELRALAEARLPGRCRFLGQLAHTDLVLRAADALVLPSDSEGMPGVLIEAGLSGLPAVATDVGFVSDVVRHGETGILTPPQDVDAIAAGLINVLANRDRFGASATARCLHMFERDCVLDRWEQLLRRLVTQATPA
jgi:glycosyltransferase involved in cell wall biosynthesis